MSRFIPIAGLVLLLLVCIAGVVLGQPFVPVDMQSALQPPSFAHPLGTDRLGRDIALRTVLATRAFFLPGLAGAGIALVLGVPLGAYAGYAPLRDGIDRLSPWARRLDTAGRGVVTLILSVPSALPRFVLILLLFAAFGFGPWVLALSAGFLYAGELGEELRLRVFQCSRAEYVRSARAEGLSTSRIIGLHIIWLQARGLIARHLVHVWSFVILVETSLSYLPGEFGLQEPEPSWGNMLVGGQDVALTGHYLPSLVPTLAIVLTVSLLAALGDRLEGGE